MGRASFWFVPQQAFNLTVTQRLTITLLQFGDTMISTNQRIKNTFMNLFEETLSLNIDMHQILYIFINAKNPEFHIEISPSFESKTLS